MKERCRDLHDARASADPGAQRAQLAELQGEVRLLVAKAGVIEEGDDVFVPELAVKGHGLAIEALERVAVLAMQHLQGDGGVP